MTYHFRDTIQPTTGTGCFYKFSLMKSTVEQYRFSVTALVTLDLKVPSFSKSLSEHSASNLCKNIWPCILCPLIMAAKTLSLLDDFNSFYYLLIYFYLNVGDFHL